MSIISFLEDFEDTLYISPITSITGTWLRTTTRAFAGTNSFTNSIVGHSASSSATLTIVVPTGMTSPTLTLLYSVSSESGFDFFNITVNGVAALINQSGEIGWTSFSRALNIGTNTVVLSYSKNGSITAGSDRAWIDNLRVTYTIPSANTLTSSDSHTDLVRKSGLNSNLTINSVIVKAILPAPINSNSILNDAISSRFIFWGFNVHRFGSNRFDEQHRAFEFNVGNNTTLLDQISSRFSLPNVGLTSVTSNDGLALRVRTQQLATLNLMDNIMSNIRGVMTDNIALNDLLSLSVRSNVGNSALVLNDNIVNASLGHIRAVADTLELTDSLHRLIMALCTSNITFLDELNKYPSKRLMGDRVIPFDMHEQRDVDTSLINPSTWIVGSNGSQVNYPQNGETSCNSIIEYPDPFGKLVPTWRTLNNDITSDADGGWATSSFPIDNTRLYRFSVWVKRKVLGNGLFYLGCIGLNGVTNTGVLNNNDGITNNTNPYFDFRNWSGQGFNLNEWVLVVGHVYPHNSIDNSNRHPNSGWYNLRGEKFSEISVRDFRWRTDNTRAIHRTFLFYSTLPETEQLWCYPRVDLCNGSEPTIMDLLEGYSSSSREISPTYINTNTPLLKRFGKVEHNLLGTLDSVTHAISSMQVTSMTIADSISARFGIPLNNALTIVDNIALSSVTRRTHNSDLFNLVDSLINNTRKSDSNLIELNDSLATTRTNKSLTDVESLVDIVSSMVRPLMQNVLNATDNLAVMSRHFEEDSVSINDNVTSLNLGKVLSSVCSLADNLNNSLQAYVPRRAIFGTGIFSNSLFGNNEDTEILGLEDSVSTVLARMIQTLLEDLAVLSEGIRIESDKNTNEIENVNDQFGIRLGKSMSSLTVLDDSNNFNIFKLISETATLTSNLVTRMVKALSGSINVTDNLSMKNVLDYHNLLGTLDSVNSRTSKLFGIMVSVQDDLRVGIQSSRDESVQIAEMLGAKVNRTPDNDYVGIIDENALKIALGLINNSLGLVDSLVDWRKFTMLNQVFILDSETGESISVPVMGLSISHSARERVSTCNFSIPDPTERILKLCQQRAEIRVYLMDGEGHTDYFGGYIKDNPIESQSALTTRLEITAHDYTIKATDIRVLERLSSESHGSLSDFVKFIWTKYSPFELDLSGVNHTDKTIPVIVLKYLNLFDSTEKLAQLLGWTWYIDYDGSKKTLRFFPANGVIKDITFSREHFNVVAGTAKFGQDDKVFNRLFVFGGNTLSIDYTQRITVNAHDFYYSLHHRPFPPTGKDQVVVKVGGIEKNVGFDYPYWVEGKDCLLNPQSWTIRWNEITRPPVGTVFEVTYRFEYPIALTLEDSDSIKKFGVVEEVFTDPSITDSREAREVAKQMLKDKSFPKGYGSLETIQEGLRAGDIVKVNLPHLNVINQTFEIVDIEKRVEGILVRRLVTLNIADSPEARIAYRLKEFAKRLADLELKDLDEQQGLQKITVMRDNIDISDTFKKYWGYLLANHVNMVDNMTRRTNKPLSSRPPMFESVSVVIPQAFSSRFGTGRFGTGRFTQGVIVSASQ